MSFDNPARDRQGQTHASPPFIECTALLRFGLVQQTHALLVPDRDHGGCVIALSLDGAIRHHDRGVSFLPERGVQDSGQGGSQPRGIGVDHGCVGVRISNLEAHPAVLSLFEAGRHFSEQAEERDVLPLQDREARFQVGQLAQLPDQASQALARSFGFLEQLAMAFRKGTARIAQEHSDVAGDDRHRRAEFVDREREYRMETVFRSFELFGHKGSTRTVGT
jgi:hypothetical protein